MPDPIDPKTLAFATESGLDPYRRYTEAETAATLGLSHGTVRRLRLLKQIGFVRVSPRRIRIFGFQIAEYLLQSVEQPPESPPCPAIIKPETSRSATIGSRNGAAAQPGAAHGSTTPLDKQSALASARRILAKPRND